MEVLLVRTCLVLLGLFLHTCTSGVKLSDYVYHYEGLSYVKEHVIEHHARHRRSAPNDDHHVPIQFSAHGKDFKIKLIRDHSVFHNNLRIENYQGDLLHHLDTSHVYHGHLENDPKSYCFGAIREGIFDGQIRTKDGIYYVERIEKYLKDLPTNDTKNIHSVIYHESFMKDPLHHSRKASAMGSSCATEANRRWMENIQNSAVDKDEFVQARPNSESVEKIIMESDPRFKYTAEANTRRKKRSIDNPNNKKSCSLYIQTDPLFWNHIKEQEKDDQKTEEEILSLIAQHVKAVNLIYSDTRFNGKYKHKGYQFEVQRIKIHDNSRCKVGVFTQDYNKFCVPNIDVSNFLNMHSKSNHEEFCLAYVFTYRDFTGGTLGLAWVASASGASGGICETYKRYTENVNGVHQMAKRSLNTGIITFVNYNSRVPPKVSQLTLAHEIGHNFGSPHDYPEECRPGGQKGNFIMFASATSGDLLNNNQFSNCSKANISEVLDAISDGRKPNCFTESDGAFCGNKIVEHGEECDCGFDEQECAEVCCFPRKSNKMTEEENKRYRCTRKPQTECSPSEGPCCDRSCRFIHRRDRIQCKHDNDCTEAAVCNGLQATCPEPRFKQDNVTECNKGTQVCQKGECKDTICLKYGLASCFLTSEFVADKRQLCELACQVPNGHGNKSQTCMSTTELVKAGYIPKLQHGLSLRPGSPCDNYRGYCDVFLKCRKVDADGPLAKLKNILFNEKTLLTVTQWVTEFWWAVLLMKIAFVIFMALFIKCFAIHTPSSNPNLPKNLNFSETLRRPVRSLQQKHYRPANRSQGPPPPYPGFNSSQQSSSSNSQPSGGPGRGYGEGRGHYNRSRSNHNPPGRGSRSGGGGGGNGGRSLNASARPDDRTARIEMQLMK
ncbi:disintegrin and metalloproteinase domain-containing protein 10 isoform X2 [Lepeophtheirus salmonis]|uniref:ADAM10 endopeptidase n=1 Tax=Lepeophtheirus salmonis TaxID=72036 RepID=A0A0K2TUR5_LEPSM|nr:disintegrin and metalloproteinase domain-containing protein 10-like isoform X2 [Lepeophtheirus salmonis]